MTSSVPKRVVYTILLGGYEELLTQPSIRDCGIDAFCFTDNPELTSEDWTIVHVAPRYPNDIVRSQREIKTRVTRHLGFYSESLYIDNTVQLKVDPEKILEDWLVSGDVVLAAHSFRDRLIDEFDEVVRLNYDDAIRVHEQLWDYALVAPDLLEKKPLWTGMIARRHTPEVSEAMEIWFEQILRYSRRDQLSVRYALDASSCEVRVLEHDNFESKWHKWSVSGSRKISQGKKSSIPAGPLAADIARMKSEIDSLRADNSLLSVRVSGKDAEIDAIKLRCAELVDAQTARVRGIETSTSWRVTSPLRWVARLRRGSAKS